MKALIVHNSVNPSVMILRELITAFQQILIVRLILRHNDLRNYVHLFCKGGKEAIRCRDLLIDCIREAVVL